MLEVASICLYMQGSQDHVQSYFGMRKISLGHVPGETNPRILLNNMFVFQMGVLDQVSFVPNSMHAPYTHHIPLQCCIAVPPMPTSMPVPVTHALLLLCLELCCAGTVVSVL